MNFLDRIRSMVGLGNSTDNLGDATMRRSIRTDDAAREAQHGDMAETTRNVRSFSEELDRKARKIG